MHQFLPFFLGHSLGVLLLVADDLLVVPPLQDLDAILLQFELMVVRLLLADFGKPRLEPVLPVPVVDHS